MAIGTARPSADERRRVPHLLIDSIDPSERYSAAKFVDDALAAIRGSLSRGVTPLLVGGTGLYFERLRGGVGPQVLSDPSIHDALLRRAEQEDLHGELRRVDPEAASAIHPNDRQRIVRALAVFTQTGKKISQLQRESVPPADLEFIVAALLPPRELLYERINRRVDAMVAAGLWEEFVSLRKRGYGEDAPGLQCLGYQELFAVEKGDCTLTEAAEAIKRNTRRYAKRQISWFRAHDGGAFVAWSDDEALLASRVTEAWAWPQ